MRYIGIDIGIKKTGLAISDSTNTFASPIEVIKTSEVLEKVKTLSNKYETNQIVIGDGRTIKGVENESVVSLIDTIAEKIKKEGLEVHLQDESFSSQEANRFEKGNDAKAAAIILQRFLER